MTRFDTDSPVTIQAADAIDGFKISGSPPKKLDFTGANKENCDVAVPIMGIPDLDAIEPDAPQLKPKVAETIKEEESHEPLLQENPQRFVLFPIKYHEVCLSRLRRVRERVKQDHRLT